MGLVWPVQMQGCRQEPATSKFHHLKEILLLAEISTKHKYTRLILKVHRPKELAGFINVEPADVFLGYIPANGHSSSETGRDCCMCRLGLVAPSHMGSSVGIKT